MRVLILIILNFSMTTALEIDEDLSEVVDIPPAGGLLSKGANKVAEPPPPVYLH